jgi:ABC-type amino acid transport system permease subunit|mmetsp:Transcript_9828/g.12701  ORF Transcript_9828/g.12701 Transcript_9828/m.12701 type:complete len:156 (-) Transcript_9828:535-1002(-)
MPKIAGVNLLGVLLAAVAMFFIGFIWYGLVFTEPWMAANGLFYTDETKTAMQWLTADGLTSVSADAGPQPMIMLAGFVLSLVLSFGLGWHMKQKNISKLGTAVLFGLWISLLIGLPLIAYDTVYTPYGSLMGFFVDGSHTVATIIAACAIMSLFD